MVDFDFNKARQEAAWLLKHPWFDEKPASIREFLGPGYLNIDALVRPGLKKALIDIFGETVGTTRICEKYEKAMFTGGIGIGKTTFASIALPYMVHWCLCLKDPCSFFNLLPGSQIAIMQMSTSAKQATGVVFSDIFARIKNSEWFANNYPYDDKYTKEIKFEKNMWILPGGSLETSFEGYNILGGVLDEMDSHKITEEKDYADIGYDAINSRIASRFPIFGDDGMEAGHKGLIICIGQMKKGNGFAARKLKEFMQDPKAYCWRQTIWESFGWDRYTNKKTGKRASFWYDTKRKKIIPDGVASLVENVDHVMEIPSTYRNQFETNPEKALRDLAGIPPASSDPFISLVDRIEECRERWIARFTDNTDFRFSHWLPESPVGDDAHRINFAKWFRVESDPRKRHIHVDLGISPEGDALGMAMGHVQAVVENDDGEKVPYIVFDALMRMHAAPGNDIQIADVRRIIYDLKEDRGFKIYSVSMDGFQCFTGDTMVPLLDGRTLSMQELSEKYPDGGVYTYSYDGNKIVPGRVTKAWRTAKKIVIKVGLDNGEVISCTPDHPFMLRNGDYKKAHLLESGDSLMPLYRRIVTEDTGHMDNYEQVIQPTKSGGRWQYTHRMVNGVVPEGYVTHHEDHNHFNNSPENLEVITRGEHSAHHSQKEYWTEDRTKSVSDAISKSNSELTGLDARRRRHDVTIADLESVMDLSRRAVTEKYGWSQDMIYARVREAGYTGWTDFKKNHVPRNHKVVFVDLEGHEEDVYDLQIEDHQNFALLAGVFVHNSTDMMQQLRKKHYMTDYLSVDKSTLPYEDLRDAIYERRVEFPPYITHLRLGDADRVEIALTELMELQHTGKKIDHPPQGSKDVADAMAGVVTTLMGDRVYRKGVISQSTPKTDEELQATGTTGMGSVLSFPGGGNGLQAPIPPTSTGAGGLMGLTIPPRLQPKGKR